MPHDFGWCLRRASLLGLLVIVAPPLRAQETAATPTIADDEMYKRKNCLACHHPERHVNGPAFRAVAAKYAGDTTAASRLAKKVRAGGGGVWGPDAMPAQAQVTSDEALALVRWILSLKSDD